ncbi:MAG: cell division protein FtsA, partial [Moraxellaceae bacterium]|nr:cell division protein FtsA [Moraxellaceae bacterium]
MTNFAQAQMIVAVDVGTSKVICLVGQINPTENTLEIIGVGMRPSKGMRKGVVVNIEQTMEAIHGAVAEAELMADCKIHSAYIGIAGSHIGGRNAQAVVAIRDGEVAQSDIDRVIDAAKSGANPVDNRILHVLPQEFLVDDQADVRSPLGMAGVRLEGHIHVVTCSANAAHNLEKCVRGAGLEIDAIVLEQVASSHAVLTEDEKELGVCLVDIGGGTTDIAVFVRGSIRHTAVIPIAGDQVTNDIAMALRTPTPAADEIKTRYACVVPQMVDPEQTISVPGMGDRPARTLARQTLSA